MINLMKYEIRKQLISKIIIVSIIVLHELIFLFGILTRNESIIKVTDATLMILSFFCILYLALEPATVFENDLGKKQGYLLFMTPNSSMHIISAKLLAGILQLSVLFALVIGIIAMNDQFLSWYSRTDVNQLDKTFNAFGDVGFSFAEFIATGIMLILIWVDFITLTFLVTSISYAYIAKGKVNTFFSIVLFVALFIGESLIIRLPFIMSFEGVGSAVTTLITISLLLSAIPAVINYYFTKVMLDKKVSI